VFAGGLLPPRGAPVGRQGRSVRRCGKRQVSAEAASMGEPGPESIAGGWADGGVGAQGGRAL